MFDRDEIIEKDVDRIFNLIRRSFFFLSVLLLSELIVFLI